MGYVIPSHTFPTKDTAPNPEILEGLLQAFPVVANMMDRDKTLVEELEGYEPTKVVILGFGEEKEIKL